MFFRIRKKILFDTDAIIGIIEYQATELLDLLRRNKVDFHHIHPVYIELANTDNKKKQTERFDLLFKYRFNALSLTSIEMKNALKIQARLYSLNCRTEPTDLYLAGTLLKFQPNSIYLLSGNFTHFPYPVFTRSAHVIFQSKVNGKVFSLFEINRKEIKPLKDSLHM